MCEVKSKESAIIVWRDEHDRVLTAIAYRNRTLVTFPTQYGLWISVLES